MWRTTLLLLAASLSVALARPRLKPLSTDMVNYINKINTTWTVICLPYTGYSSFTSSCWHPLFSFTLQAGHNFHNVDYSYVKKLCGTMLKGPKLPVMWVTFAVWFLFCCVPAVIQALYKYIYIKCWEKMFLYTLCIWDVLYIVLKISPKYSTFSCCRQHLPTCCTCAVPFSAELDVWATWSPLQRI